MAPISTLSTGPAQDGVAEPAGDASQPPPAYHYSSQFIGKPRPVRIIIVGSGVSGIAAVKMFKETFAHQPVELVIYEKNSDVGGTWLENRYPGCACDVPAHGYTYSWEGNPLWSRAYVGAIEIFNYYKGRAKAYGVEHYLRLQHRVEKAVWNASEGKWEVHIRDLESNSSLVDKAEVLINATGFLNKWKWPEIVDLDKFRGFLVHSARWDDSYDFTGKNVGIIGSGSSAIQILPRLQPHVKHMVSFNRSATWITPEFVEELAVDGRDTQFSAEQQAKWVKEPSSFLEYRKHIETGMNKVFDLQFKDSKLQKDAFIQYSKTMRDRLKERPELAEKLIPTFAVGCRRFTPGHNYLESLASENVTVETGQILKCFADGIEMEDGTKHNLDAIVCATGFDTSFRPFFPVIGDEGKDLRDVWEHEPRSYLSIAASGFPNYFMTSGPNFTLANGALIPCLEKCIEYAFKAVTKIQTQGIKSMSPKAAAVNEFQEHKDSIMKDFAWSSGCRSWYKNGTVDGKVWGPWCGSSLHFLQLMSEPRWEDWDITYTTRNRYQYLGYGKTELEETGGDLAYYLKEPNV